MKVVSTVHKAGFDSYGARFLEGLKYWPDDAEFVVYTEGFAVEHDRVTFKRIEDVEHATSFKKQYGHYKSPSWTFDVVRFSNKVFAVYDALYEHDGIGVWLDADCITYKQLPDDYVRALLPAGSYIARFERTGMHTETGFWVMDCTHSQHKTFMDTWLRWYTTGSFKNLSQWHDCETMDATVRLMKRSNLIETVSLSGKYDKNMHPMSMVDLARYIDHQKGNRKDMTASPENKFRNAA